MSSARQGAELIEATKPFAKDSPRRSWWYLGSTLTIWVGLLAAAALAPVWPLRAVASVFAGLVTVRGFILYHDYMHAAILRRSPLARAVFGVYGSLVLTPPRVWRETHNYHHANNCKIAGSHVGSYPIVTPAIWETLTPSQRLRYRLARHPMTILCGYLTVFVWGMCLSSLLRQPKKNWDSGVALLAHGAAITALLTFGDWQLFLFVYLIPLCVATASGGYLFYAQHNFEGVRIRCRTDWEYTVAALESSSYLRMGPLMRWFTGNIGYHHVHHLNPRIPFYRLPEAMAAIPELQDPVTISLHPRDVFAGFRLKLWDPDQDRMIPFPAARAR